ncbi:MAG: type I 3-dehydroquinate dehydratase [Chthoniobacterales bacterium]
MLNIKQINVVGTLHSSGGIASAGKHRKALNAVEFRADLLPAQVRSSALRKLPLPVIWTVRSVSEGGKGPENVLKRTALYDEGLDVASLIDVELASVAKLKETVRSAQAHRCRLILSFHDFKATPSVARLRQTIRRAEDAGADIVKIAATVDSLAALLRLMSVFDFSNKLPLSVMGMGRFGKVSRLLCAQAGSVLNYGWLDKPQVSGQWAAEELAARFAELQIKRAGRG